MTTLRDNSLVTGDEQTLPQVSGLHSTDHRLPPVIRDSAPGSVVLVP